MRPESSRVPADRLGTAQSPARVAPLLRSAGNQQLLLDWLSQHEQYETVSNHHDGLADADVVVLDECSLRDHECQIRECNSETAAFLPVLLVRADTGASSTAAREETVQSLVDEVLPTPIENAALRRRLDVLIRIRAQSLALKRTADQFLLLNRITRHDIRNQMNVILGWTRELESHTDETGDPIRQRVLDSSQHVVDLTQSLREFTETLQTTTDPDLGRVDLEAVLTSELAARRRAFDGAEFVVAGEIPAGHVRANDLLASVFRNLLDNAVHHSDADTPRVEVTAVERDEMTAVTVADNGPGIPPDQREAVLGRTDRGLDHPAAGLGLYLVDTLVEQFDGTTQIDEADIGGAAVTVAIPRAPVTGVTER
jgi:signal transduction histidine kinase